MADEVSEISDLAALVSKTYIVLMLAAVHYVMLVMFAAL